MFRKLTYLIISLILLLFFTGCKTQTVIVEQTPEPFRLLLNQSQLLP
ncbi:hypothetical protein N752_27870 [Desulforamulus aquiferis]|nr:hypothetical protein N752_27870 [Desulforamulus aquiferis]